MMSSVAALSEAIHSGIDLLAPIKAVYTVTRSAQPADEDHNNGHCKFEDVSATVEAVLIHQEPCHVPCAECAKVPCKDRAAPAPGGPVGTAAGSDGDDSGDDDGESGDGVNSGVDIGDGDGHR